MAKPTKFRFTQKSEKDKEKDAILYVEFSLDRRYKLALGESIKPIWWDSKLHRAIVVETGQQKQADTRNAKRINKFLDSLEKELTRFFDDFKDWFLGIVTNRVTLLSVVFMILGGILIYQAFL